MRKMEKPLPEQRGLLRLWGVLDEFLSETIAGYTRIFCYLQEGNGTGGRTMDQRVQKFNDVSRLWVGKEVIVEPNAHFSEPRYGKVIRLMVRTPKEVALKKQLRKEELSLGSPERISPFEFIIRCDNKTIRCSFGSFSKVGTAKKP